MQQSLDIRSKEYYTASLARNAHGRPYLTYLRMSKERFTLSAGVGIGDGIFPRLVLCCVTDTIIAHRDLKSLQQKDWLSLCITLLQVYSLLNHRFMFLMQIQLINVKRGSHTTEMKHSRAKSSAHCMTTSCCYYFFFTCLSTLFILPYYNSMMTVSIFGIGARALNWAGCIW